MIIVFPARSYCSNYDSLLIFKTYFHPFMKKAQAFLEKFPLFLLTIPLFIIIHLEAEYRSLIQYKFVYVEIIQLLLAPFLIFILCCLIFKKRSKRIMYCLLLTILFFFFADVKDFFYKISPGSAIASYSFLLPAVLTICIAGYFIIRRSNSGFSKTILFINLLFIFFILADGFIILFTAGKNPKKFYLENNSIVDNYQPCNTCSKPDIYYILFDYYTSTKSLKKYFNYDNSNIDSFLARKGFFVAGNSRSNYNFTVHSMSSIFNMNYLKKITPFKKIYLKDYLPVIGSIYDNELVSILKKEGYSINNVSIFDFKNNPSQVPHFNLWAYDILYSRHNIFKKIDSEIGWIIKSKLAGLISFTPPVSDFVSAKESHDSLALRLFEKNIAKKNAPPAFTYLHIEKAHAPFVVDSTGLMHEQRPWPVSLQQDKADYVSQLVYTNTILKQTINTIFEKSSRPFIIILQGDHGFRFFDPKMSAGEFDNLNAFYFPDKNYSSLNDSITSVNTFRFVLNKFFNQDFELLKDSLIFADY